MPPNSEINADWVNQVLAEASEHFRDATKVAEQADRRHSDLMRVHKEGWQQVARAIDGGLRAIADAIRSRR